MIKLIKVGKSEKRKGQRGPGILNKRTFAVSFFNPLSFSTLLYSVKLSPRAPTLPTETLPREHWQNYTESSLEELHENGLELNKMQMGFSNGAAPG